MWEKSPSCLNLLFLSYLISLGSFFLLSLCAPLKFILIYSWSIPVTRCWEDTGLWQGVWESLWDCSHSVGNSRRAELGQHPSPAIRYCAWWDSLSARAETCIWQCDTFCCAVISALVMPLGHVVIDMKQMLIMAEKCIKCDPMSLFVFQDFVVIHNGIITNYKEIKAFLVSVHMLGHSSLCTNAYKYISGMCYSIYHQATDGQANAVK